MGNIFYSTTNRNMSDDDNEFEKTDAGSSSTTLVEAGRRKPGSLLMMKEEFPCKVTSFSTAKPGKHGSAKAMITGKDIFTDKQYEETFGTGDTIPMPVVKKNEYTCIDVNDDGKLQMLDKDGNLIEHLNCPSEAHLSDLKKRIKTIIDDGKKECLVQVQV